MNFHKYILTTALLSSVSMTVPAHADITADDVLAMYETYVERIGGQLSSQTSRSGNALEVTDIEFDFQLPLGMGYFSAGIDSLSLIENGDGTVNLVYPDTISMKMSGKVGEEPEVAFAIDSTTVNMNAVASGDPGNFTIDYSVDQMKFAPGVGTEMFMEFFNFNGIGTGISGRTHFVDGEVLQVTGDNVIKSMSFNIDGEDPSGGSSSTVATYTDMISKVNLSLPSNMSVMNLSAALRDGLNAQLVASTGSTSSRTEVTGGGINMLQEITQGTSNVEYTLDESGLGMSGIAHDIALNIAGLPEMPFPISAAFGSADFNLTTPLNASELEQDFALGLSLNDIVMDESLWSLIDGGRILPRDPAQIALDLEGRAKTFVDLLDIMGLASIGQSGEMPGELNSLRLKNLRIALAGADLTGSGEFTFDNSDLVTFGGLPRPEGAVDLALSGANGLMDALVSMGLLPEDQAMGARMMLGFFAVPGEEEDSLTSTIEINSQGHVLANGQRLQ